MKGRKHQALRRGMIMIICLLSVAVTSCKKANTYTEISEVTEEETLHMEEETAQDTDSMFTESEEDTIAKNLLCLKNADTRALVGLSFGDALDYDGYRICGWSEDEVRYQREACAYGDVGLVFGGRGNGFSGLKQYWSGNFFGIILGEDTIDVFTDVLGEPDTWEEKASGSETALWAVWNFEDAMLSVRIKEGKVRAVEYLANGTIADAQEKPTDETDLGRDRQTAQACVEAVYNWSACRPDSGGQMELENGQLGYDWSVFRSGSEEGYAMYSPYDDDYDAGKVEAFVQNYLLSQGIDKETPDGAVYNQNGDLFVEYYVDKENAEYCFIVHLWGEYWLDYDNGISAYQDEVYCTAHTLREEDIAGYVICEQDTARQTAQERLYDIWGKKVAEVSYEYIPEMPFPLVTQEWNFTAGFSLVPLIRNQKMWFYKEQAQFDAEGKFCSYSSKENDGSEYFPYPCRTVYNTDGRLQAIQEELQEEDIENKWGWWDDSIDYSGQIAFDYDTDGTIKHAEYVRSSYTHGTTDSSGTIDYDENGRMIENDYYITHGGHTDIFLYEGDSTMPWCVLHWCSFESGFENIYLFLPEL